MDWEVGDGFREPLHDKTGEGAQGSSSPASPREDMTFQGCKAHCSDP